MTATYHPFVLGGIAREKHNMPSTLCHFEIPAKWPGEREGVLREDIRLEDEGEDATMSASLEKIMVANTATSRTIRVVGMNS